MVAPFNPDKLLMKAHAPSPSDVLLDKYQQLC